MRHSNCFKENRKESKQLSYERKVLAFMKAACKVYGITQSMLAVSCNLSAGTVGTWFSVAYKSSDSTNRCKEIYDGFKKLMKAKKFEHVRKDDACAMATVALYNHYVKQYYGEYVDHGTREFYEQCIKGITKNYTNAFNLMILYIFDDTEAIY